MRSLESCWLVLKDALENQVIVSMAAGAFEIWPVGSGSRGEEYLTQTPERIVGVYSPGTQYEILVDDARTINAIT